MSDKHLCEFLPDLVFFTQVKVPLFSFHRIFLIIDGCEHGVCFSISESLSAQQTIVTTYLLKIISSVGTF